MPRALYHFFSTQWVGDVAEVDRFVARGKRFRPDELRPAVRWVPHHNAVLRGADGGHQVPFANVYGARSVLSEDALERPQRPRRLLGTPWKVQVERTCRHPARARLPRCCHDFPHSHVQARLVPQDDVPRHDGETVVTRGPLPLLGRKGRRLHALKKEQEEYQRFH